MRQASKGLCMRTRQRTHSRLASTPVSPVSGAENEPAQLTALAREGGSSAR